MVGSLNKSDLYELDQYWVLLYQLFNDGIIENPYREDKSFDILKDEEVSFTPNQIITQKVKLPYLGSMSLIYRMVRWVRIDLSYRGCTRLADAADNLLQQFERLLECDYRNDGFVNDNL